MNDAGRSRGIEGLNGPVTIVNNTVHGTEGTVEATGILAHNGVIRDNQVLETRIVRGASGELTGIEAGNDMVVRANEVVNRTLGGESAGIGIAGSEETVCRANLVVGFDDPISDCIDAGGNHPSP